MTDSVYSTSSSRWDCICGAPADAEPYDHDTDCPEHPTGGDDEQ
jgi:hypothetical protein